MSTPAALNFRLCPPFCLSLPARKNPPALCYIIPLQNSTQKSVPARQRARLQNTTETEMYGTLKGEMEAMLRAEVDALAAVLRNDMHATLRNEMQVEITACMTEKESLLIITGSNEKLNACKKQLEEYKGMQGMAGTPQMQEEIKELKTQIEQEIKTFVEVTKRIEAEVEEMPSG